MDDASDAAQPSRDGDKRGAIPAEQLQALVAHVAVRKVQLGARVQINSHVLSDAHTFALRPRCGMCVFRRFVMTTPRCDAPSTNAL